MPPATATSNIRAYVQWREPSVYAGEEIECIITLKNIAKSAEQHDEDDVQTPLANGYHSRSASNAPSATESRRSSVVQARPLPSRTQSSVNMRGAPATRGHRPALSLNVFNAPPRGGLHGAPIQAKMPGSAINPAKGHGRSLSIMSLGSDSPRSNATPTTSQSGRRPTRGHGRSASLQVTPKSAPLQQNTAWGIAPPRQPSPLFESNTPPALAEGEPLPLRPGRRRPGTVSAENTPQLGKQSVPRRSPKPNGFDAGFTFPAQPSDPRSTSPPKPPRSPSTMHSAQFRPGSPRPPEGWSGALSNLNPITRVMSESSTMSNTPRSSGEFYSMSNHSDETLTSEAPYQQHQNGRLLPKPAHSRQTSRLLHANHARPAEPETLMMGYAQTMGYFTLDGSLVNAAPFEEVKRKGIQTGGGVVGIERSKRASGMFGAFSWNSIGESLGGLLGADETSSIAQMKATAGSRSVPLLSTPQSLLFVDLCLAPGESRSYSYRFALPRGLPPSHRGRAIKVHYHLALGIQRPGTQAVKTVEIPIQVLGSYNSRGESLGHDLMSPYILLHDAARTASIVPESVSLPGTPRFPAKQPQTTAKGPKQGLEDFLRYTERLLDQSTDANTALLSPTSPAATPALTRKQSIVEQPPASVKEAIDLAILRSNYASTAALANQPKAHSVNRFNITRAGQPVAVLTLLRPAYRLGEAITGTLDFTSPSDPASLPPQAPTYAVLIELESAERIDPSLALRSSSSINRVTRKVHASIHENTLFARQVSFNLTIPATATPTFETTGVGLAWRLRVEFTTQRQAPGLGNEGHDDVGEEEMLEELGTDERGTALIARERLMADTFEVAVPIRVFGAPGVEGIGSASGGGEAYEV